jgi:hypothetical protein
MYAGEFDAAAEVAQGRGRSNVATRKGGGARIGTSNVSTQIIRARVTPEEHEEANALAAYSQLSLSDLVRRLLKEERARLVALGKRPPRR